MVSELRDLERESPFRSFMKPSNGKRNEEREREEKKEEIMDFSFLREETRGCIGIVKLVQKYLSFL